MADQTALRTPAAARLNDLRAELPVVVPALLLCDFGHLHEEVARIEASGAKAVHLDVMDGHFVPNITYGMPIVQAVRKATRLPIDVHLMIDHPERYLTQLRDAGADNLTVHIEALGDTAAALAKIRELGLSAGLALNPPTPLSAIEPHLTACDLVLVMGVMPGFGGQAFDRVALEKLARLRGLVEPQTLLEVDGGVHEQTIGACAHAGAQLLVAGSAIFGHENYRLQLTTLTDLAREGRSSD